MANALDIAEKTRKVDVDNRLSLRFYYRTASNLLQQASIYRDERNVIDLYILLLRFSSLVSETIPNHRDYRTAPREKAEYTKKLKSVIGELEQLKPEVQKQVDRLNKVHQVPTSSANQTEWNVFTTQWPSAPRKPVKLEEDPNKELFSLGVRQYHDPVPSGQNNLSSLPGKNTNDDLHRSLNNLALNIPRPKDETLSRHSIFAANVSRRQPSVAPVRPHYPNYVDASPIEMPSLEQNWQTFSQQQVVSNGSSSLHSLAEPVLWPEADIYTPVIGPNLAPAPSLSRQPDPPPMAAPVQTLEPLDYPGHHQLPPDRVADPRPRSPQNITNGLGQEEGTKHLHISTRLMDEFLALARLNTQKNLETCGVLAGFLKKGVFYVSALIVPKQEATSDSCQTINEEEIFDAQDKRGLFQLGWIHTHPTQTCFMSSIDLHTHYSYQVMLHEAIAVVMAPTDTQRKCGIFRLTEPGGIKSIQQCDQRGFHPHEALEDGGPIYEHSGHVFMSPKLRFDVIDLRQD